MQQTPSKHHTHTHTRMHMHTPYLIVYKSGTGFVIHKHTVTWNIYSVYLNIYSVYLNIEEKMKKSAHLFFQRKNKTKFCMQNILLSNENISWLSILFITYLLYNFWNRWYLCFILVFSICFLLKAQVTLVSVSSLVTHY